MLVRALLVSLLLLSAVACVQGEVGGDDGLDVAALVWNPKYRWSSNDIPVCWESGDPAWATEREWVRRRSIGSWDYVSGANFVGWGTCTDSSRGIRIRVSDEGPHVATFGRALDGKGGGMVLNFTFRNWSPVCASQREFCIKAIAVHEFGHALGFFHENDRPDRPSGCDPTGSHSGEEELTGYDRYSIMNYCNPSWNNDGFLSARDIEGARFAYGYGAGQDEDGPAPSGTGSQELASMEGDAPPADWSEEDGGDGGGDGGSGGGGCTAGLAPGQALAPREGVTSCDGRFLFLHQDDGNVVLYQTGQPIWASNTYGQATSTLVMQDDGNLVLYGDAGALWDSGTWGHDGARLAVQDDGNVVLYGPDGAALWATGTSG